jgi:hypothetical protein
MNELVIINQSNYAPVAVREVSGNYELALPSGQVRQLERNKDFGNPVTKSGKNAFPQPILYKGGAEKILHDYKVFPRYDIEYSEENSELGYFFYRFKCRLVAINPSTGDEITVEEGYGSSNTRESKGGNASGFDLANSTLKNAKKRSMVDAAINLAGLSSIFTQDMENESFMNAAVTDAGQKDDDPITPKQRQRVFALGSQVGMSTEKMKTWLKAEGYASVKDITLKNYDAVCDKLIAMQVSSEVENAD